MSKGAIESAAVSLFKRLGRKILDRILSGRSEKAPPPKNEQSQLEKVHPWRACGIGYHWVRTHPLSVPLSEKNPEGVTIRDGHCARNPARTVLVPQKTKGGKIVVKKRKRPPVNDYLTPDEIHLISSTHFANLEGLPTAGKLPFKNEGRYDSLIRGWSRYWNEVFNPSTPLDPDLVKTLVATESSFNPKPEPQNAGRNGKARGCLQITDLTVKELSNSIEAEPHHIRMTQEDANDPDVSICAGIRWLFLARQRASTELNREATWSESIAEYKGYLKAMRTGKNPHPTGMKKIEEYYNLLKK